MVSRSFLAGLAALGCLVPDVARASFVDFAGLQLGSGFTTTPWSETVDGVTITVTPSVGSDSIYYNPVLGFRAYGYDAQSAVWGQESQHRGIDISFSEPVDIVAADIVDVERQLWAGCSGYTCPFPSLYTNLCAVSVDGGAARPFSASAPASGLSIDVPPVTYQDPSGPVTYGVHSAGFAPIDTNSHLYATPYSVDDFTFRQDIGTSGSQVDFTAANPPISPPSNNFFDQNYSEFSVRVIEFERAMPVPELSNSGAVSAAAVLMGALAIVTGRRRRRPA